MIRSLGPPEIGRRAKDPAVIARVAQLKQEIADLTPRPEAAIFLKETRALTGKTQAEFAAAYGFNRRTLERWERGASKPRDSDMRKLREIHAEMTKP